MQGSVPEVLDRWKGWSLEFREELDEARGSQDVDDDIRQRGPPPGSLRQFLTSPGRFLTPSSVLSNGNVKCHSEDMLLVCTHVQAAQGGVDRS